MSADNVEKLQTVELELPETSNVYPKCLKVVLKRYMQPHQKKFNLIKTVYWLVVIIALLGLYEYLPQVNYFEDTKPLSISMLCLATVWFIGRVDTVIYSKMFYKLFYQASIFTESSHFYADSSKVIQTGHKESYIYQSSWQFVKEVFEFQQHIVINFGINCTVIPKSTFQTDEERQRVFEQLKQWHKNGI